MFANHWLMIIYPNQQRAKNDTMAIYNAPS
jgi:hypothetical protein